MYGCIGIVITFIKFVFYGFNRYASHISVCIYTYHSFYHFTTMYVLSLYILSTYPTYTFNLSTSTCSIPTPTLHPSYIHHLQVRNYYLGFSGALYVVCLPSHICIYSVLYGIGNVAFTQTSFVALFLIFVCFSFSMTGFGSVISLIMQSELQVQVTTQAFFQLFTMLPWAIVTFGMNGKPDYATEMSKLESCYPEKESFGMSLQILQLSSPTSLTSINTHTHLLNHLTLLLPLINHRITLKILSSFSSSS